jgi:hypothetical protein
MADVVVTGHVTGGFVRQSRPQLFVTSDRTSGPGEVDVCQF